MAYSNTISQTAFITSDVIDEAYRLCGLTAQQITSEMQDTAQKQLYLHLSPTAPRHLVGRRHKGHPRNGPVGQNSKLRPPVPCNADPQDTPWL